MSLLFIGHPSEADLALFAGGELGPLARWRIEKHLTDCDGCRETVSDFFHLQSEISELSDLPSLDWSALAGRIKLAVADAQSAPRREQRWFLARPLVVGTGLAMATLLCAFIVVQQFPVSEVADLGEVASLYEKQDAGAASAEADAVVGDRSAFAPEQFAPREEAVFEATPEGAGAASLGGEAGSYYENEKKPIPAGPEKALLAPKNKRNALQPAGELVARRGPRGAELGNREVSELGQLVSADAPSFTKPADKKVSEGAARSNEPLSQVAAVNAQTESNEGIRRGLSTNQAAPALRSRDDEYRVVGEQEASAVAFRDGVDELAPATVPEQQRLAETKLLRKQVVEEELRVEDRLLQERIGADIARPSQPVVVGGSLSRAAQQKEAGGKLEMAEHRKGTSSTTHALMTRILADKDGDLLTLSFGPDADVSLAAEGWMVRTLDSDTNTITITNVYLP